jgi:hypothetical protein
VRCKFFPECKKEDCPYVHPTEACTHFPSCWFKSECLKLHPPCKYGDRCNNMQCTFEHAASHRRQMKAMSRNPMMSMMSMMATGFRQPRGPPFKKQPRKEQ